MVVVGVDVSAPRGRDSGGLAAASIRETPLGAGRGSGNRPSSSSTALRPCSPLILYYYRRCTKSYRVVNGVVSYLNHIARAVAIFQ